jgi:hypothetical protein
MQVYPTLCDRRTHDANPGLRAVSEVKIHNFGFEKGVQSSAAFGGIVVAISKDSSYIRRTKAIDTNFFMIGARIDEQETARELYFIFGCGCGGSRRSAGSLSPNHPEALILKSVRAVGFSSWRRIVLDRPTEKSCSTAVAITRGRKRATWWRCSSVSHL